MWVECRFECECECDVCKYRGRAGQSWSVGYIGSEPKEMETGQKMDEVLSVEYVVLHVRYH